MIWNLLRARAEALVQRRESDRVALDGDEAARLIHELRIHEVELEIQNEELLRLQRELEGARAAIDRQTKLVDLVSEAIVSTDLEHRIETWNLAAERLYGWPASEAIGRDIRELLGPSFAGGQTIEEVTAELMIRHRWRGEVTKRTRDGGSRIMQVSTTLLSDADNRPVAIARIARDVTELRAISDTARAAEVHRRTQEAFIEQVIEAAPMIVAVLDLDGRVVIVNRFLETLAGRSRAELIGRSWVEALVVEADRPHVLESLAAAGTGHQTSGAIFGLAAGSGAVRTIEWHGTPLRDEGNAVRQVLVVGQDVTARGALERQLRHQASLVESVSDALYSASLDHAIRTWNPAAERLLGWRRAEVIGRRWTDLLPFTPDRSDVESMFAGLREHGRWSGDGRQLTREGDEIAVSLSVNLAIDAGGEPYAIYSVRDERQLRQVEAELRHAQKMEAIGRLASGIAHDFNNLLMGIIGCADIALTKLPPVTGAVTYLDEIKRAASGGAQITRQLLAFSRRREVEAASFDLGFAIESWAEVLRRLLGEDVSLRIIHHDRDLWIHTDRAQVQQILMNLAVNARDAMPDGGELTVELSREGWEEGGAVPAGHYAVLSVSDTGSGMDEATRQRLFEPFFTTKPVGEGTGLGLSTVYGIVRQSGGHIGVRSVEGEGTTFLIRLPLGEPGPARPEEATPPPARLANIARLVLVVEDEPLVRLSCSHYLAELGFEVVEASNGAEARQLAREHADAIDVVITDVVLPDVEGAEVAVEVREHCPRASVIFMSAHPPELLIRTRQVPAGQPILQKPFSREDLERVVAEAQAVRDIGKRT